MAINAILSDLISATPAGGDLIYIVQGGNSRQATLGTVGALLLQDTGQTTARATIGAVIGTNVQAWSANLDELATVNAGTTGKALLDDTGVSQAVETLGLTYIKDYGTHSVALRKFRSTYTDPADWTTVLQAAADSAEPCIRVHADAEITANSQWTIGSTQKWVSEGMDNKAQIRRVTVVDEPFIRIKGERSGMRNIGIKCNSNAGMTAANVGLLVERDTGEPLDLDFEFRDGYLSGFYYGLKGAGRGITVLNSLISDVRYGVDLGWGDTGKYIKDRFVGDSDVTGFRRQRVVGCEFHSIEVAGVRNRGWNSANIHCVIADNTSNFGKSIFVGKLGNGSVIRNNSITQAGAAFAELDGGKNYSLLDNIICGDRDTGVPIEPVNFLTMTGTHTGFVIDGFKGTYCENHGIDMRSGDFQGVIRNIDLREVGSATVPSYSGVIIIGTGASTRVLAEAVSLTSDSGAQTIVRMNTAGSTLFYRGLVSLGATTPATGGSGTNTAV